VIILGCCNILGGLRRILVQPEDEGAEMNGTKKAGIAVSIAFRIYHPLKYDSIFKRRQSLGRSLYGADPFSMKCRIKRRFGGKK